MMKKRCVVVICDSLRRDLIQGIETPSIQKLAQQGCQFSRMEAVFPSTTRVSSACIATGAFPKDHGLLGNTMVLDHADGLKVHSVGNPSFRQVLYQASGHYLRVPTLAQYLRPLGSSAIYSNVSPGAAYFFDPDLVGYVFHRAGSFGPGGVPLHGSQALDIESGQAGDEQMTGRFCQHVLSDDSLLLAVLWLSEPDATGHGVPLGSPTHRQAIQAADRNVARVLEMVEQLRARGEDVLVMVGSDHGMETIHAQVDIAQELVAAGLKQAMNSQELLVAPNGTAAVIAYAPDYAHSDRLLGWLQEQLWVGEVVVGDELHAWGMPNTDTCRVAVSLAGTDQVNEAGLSGMAWYAVDPLDNKSYVGYGQHGGRNTNESRPFLVVQGEGFAQGQVCSLATSLCHYAPTVLCHLGLWKQQMAVNPLQEIVKTENFSH
ncbi:alkaline phosphatase family protein [Alcaligenes aquatilis]|uniref:alkaline phosphatase family protein n=1 Tax=Alcaligenes aquatilis TaxID=323284 RepID=UPI001F0B999B|nr:alkaline phosphatase family protein [Alcaligenes aquatilis]